MSLEATKIIDAIGIEKDTGIVVLTIADGWDWSEEQKHIAALTATVDSYLRFIESGEILDTFPQAAARSVAISWITKFSLPPRGVGVLNKIRDVVESTGVNFRHEVCSGSR